MPGKYDGSQRRKTLEPGNRVKGYSRVVNGEVQQVSEYQSVRTADTIADGRPGRPPIAASRGEFPRGRSIPGVYTIPEKAPDDFSTQEGEEEGSEEQPGLPG